MAPTRACVAAGIFLLALGFLLGYAVEDSEGPTSPTTSSTSTSSTPTSTSTTTSTPSEPTLPYATRDIVGVPEGVVLQTLSENVVTEDGTVIDSKLIRGGLVVQAADVTVTRSRVEGGTARHVVHCDGCERLVVEDSELIGTTDSNQNCIAFSDYTITRSLLSGCIDGAKANGDSILTWNWIGDLRRVGSSHNDGVQSTGGTGVVIANNWIEHATGGQTSAVKVSSENRPLVDVLVESNRLISSTCYALYFTLRSGADQPLPTGTIRDNVVSGHTCTSWISRTEGPDQTVEGNVVVE